MKVGLDLQLTLGTATGIGEYAAGLAGALRAAGTTTVVPLCEPRLDPWRFDRRLLWDQVVLPARAQCARVELLHCASGTMPLAAAMPCVVTVHDVAWLTVQQHARAYARWYFGTFSLRRYMHAAAIAVDSHFSRAQLLALCNIAEQRVHVVYPGVARDFCELVCARAPDALILVPGTVERRKNLEVLVRALYDVPQARLVCVGPFTPYREECAALARRLRVEDRVEFRGYVSRGELLDLYARCAAVAMPSRYEGFGYPAAQALCAGVPLLSSNAASLPEVTGPFAALLDPDDCAGWAAAITRVLSNPGDARNRAQAVREQAISRFSWTAAAQSMIEVYRTALGSA